MIRRVNLSYQPLRITAGKTIGNNMRIKEGDIKALEAEPPQKSVATVLRKNRFVKIPEHLRELYWDGCRGRQDETVHSS